jgi:hypothetical protein
MVYTDGVGVSILKQNFPPGRRIGGDKKKGKLEDNDSFRYVEDLRKEELLADAGKCVLVNPGCRDLLYCLHENSTPKDKIVYRYIRNQRAVETKSSKFRKLRNCLKPDEVVAAELSLSQHCSATINKRKFVKYIEERSKVSRTLCVYYGNEDQPIGVRTADRLPFRKMKLSAIINRKKADKCLVRDLRRKFGEEPVIDIGNWAPSNVKYHEPIRGVGTRNMLKKEGFKVYLLDEFKTQNYDLPVKTVHAWKTSNKLKIQDHS